MALTLGIGAGTGAETGVPGPVGAGGLLGVAGPLGARRGGDVGDPGSVIVPEVVARFGAGLCPKGGPGFAVRPGLGVEPGLAVDPGFAEEPGLRPGVRGRGGGAACGGRGARAGRGGAGGEDQPDGLREAGRTEGRAVAGFRPRATVVEPDAAQAGELGAGDVGGGVVADHPGPVGPVAGRRHAAALGGDLEDPRIGLEAAGLLGDHPNRRPGR
ncbi:hypothetical protein GCM10020229_42210 [Kitasatospora albolonga]